MRPRPDDDLDDLIEPHGQAGSRPGLPVDPGRLWLSIKRNWKWIPMAAGIWAVLGLAVAFLFIRHTYKSETVLIWEPLSQGMSVERDLATQAGSLKLPATAREIKRRLKVGILAERLAKQFEVWFDTKSNLVTIEGSGATAKDAQKLAQTVVEVFLDQQKRVVQTRAAELSRTLETDVRTTRTRLDLARQAYDDFRKKEGISDIEQETRLAIETSERLKQEQQVARADATALTARADELTTLVKTQPKTTVQAASSTNPDATRLAELRAELAGARARYAPSHPRIASLEAQVTALAPRVKQGTSIVSATTTGTNPEYATLQASLSSTRADKEAAAQRGESYDTYVKAAEQRVAELSAIEGRAKGLIADVKSAETRLGEQEAQLSEARDAARAPQIEWRVLERANLPEYPERSKRRAVMAGMPIAGMLIALLALLIRPLLDGRVYTAREAGWWSRFPVLASSSWPRNRETFFTLLGDLGDQGTAARGYTLVLGATGREKALAEELAYWLGGSAVTESRDKVGQVVAPIEAPPGGVATPAAPVSGATTINASPNTSPGAVQRSEALVAFQPAVSAAAALALVPQGTHAWLGTTEGPSLRRAARTADRVIVLLTSGAEVFTAVSDLSTRLGRETGIGIVLLGLGPEYLKLPDRIGEVEEFWRRGAGRSA